MKKTLLALSLALPLSLAACSPAATVHDDDDDDDSVSSVGMMDDGDDDDMAGGAHSVAMDHSSAPTTNDADSRVVDVTVTDWTFSPATITVKQGENVSLRLVGDKGIHSLLVADLGLNVRVEPGETPTVKIPTDKTGTFAGRCGVPCGPGHRDMKFTIVVE